MLRGWVVLAVLLGFFGTTLSGNAADEKKKKKGDPEAVFKKMDKDKDGSVSEEEFVGKREGEKADKAKTQFKKLDKNSDGKLSLDEFKARGGKKKKESDS